MTAEEFLALPDDGIERWLMNGQLRELGTEDETMARRNRRHSRTMTNLAYVLKQWLNQQAGPHGELLTGDASFLLRRDPDTAVGIDVAYLSAELADQTADNAPLIEGVPILAVEILSPSDKHEEIVEKLGAYLNAGVAQVWIVDPDLRTVTVHRPGSVPVMFNAQQELSGEPELPGFRVAVAELFKR
jgi:Uma2 family endonuclease